jgi:hypothetical protein
MSPKVNGAQPAISKEEGMERERIRCEDTDKVKPLDELLDDQIKEFRSGEDRACDKDLDKMIWELGDYENEEPTTSAAEFGEEKSIEENIVEKKMIHGSNDQPYYIDAGENVTKAHSSGPEAGKRRTDSVRGNSPRKKKK